MDEEQFKEIMAEIEEENEKDFEATCGMDRF